jgi:hypothetical protein
VLRPPEPEERLFLVTRACPSWFAWDRRGGRSAFTIEDVIYVHDWRSAQVRAVASPGVANPEVGFSTQGVLLACSYEQVPVGDDGNFTYRTTVGYQADGTWKKIGYENFGQEFFDFPCSNSNDDAHSGEMRYNPRHQEPSVCTLEKAPAGPQCPSRAAIENVNAQVSDPEVILQWMVYVPLAEQRFVAFRLSDLQVTSAQAPLFAIENDTVTEIYKRQPAEADIEVLFGVDHFLVTKWRVRTFDLGGGEAESDRAIMEGRAALRAEFTSELGCSG